MSFHPKEIRRNNVECCGLLDYFETEASVEEDSAGEEEIDSEDELIVQFATPQPEES